MTKTLATGSQQAPSRESPMTDHSSFEAKFLSAACSAMMTLMQTTVARLYQESRNIMDKAYLKGRKCLKQRNSAFSAESGARG